MYEITNEVKEILDSYGINIKSRLNELCLKSTIIDCPRCGSKTRILYDPEIVKKKVPGSGIANVVIKLPCSHEFVAHVDKAFNIRGLIEIEQEIHVSTERLDIRYLKEQIEVLEKLHAKLVEDKAIDLQYKIFTELARMRKVLNSIQ